jgi:hypothetical protein
MSESEVSYWTEVVKESVKQERERIVDLLEKKLGTMDWEDLKKVIEGKHETYTSEDVTIIISKRFINGEPSHWSSEIIDVDGGYLGSSMGPDFHSTFDSSYQLITGDTGEVEDVHNTWVDFDANGDKKD